MGRMVGRSDSRILHISTPAGTFWGACGFWMGADFTGRSFDMRRISILLCAFLVLDAFSSSFAGKVAQAADPKVAEAADPAGFQPLFDGKTFKGWEGNLAVFQIRDGAVVGGSVKQQVVRNEFLCTTREYGNFELRLKVKLVGDGANGGVQIRSRRVPNHHEVAGYQADMADGYWGGLYDESRRNDFLAKPSPEEQKKIVKPNDWNQYVIRCDGPRIQLWLNGHQTVDYTESKESIAQKGIIGLQIHGGPPSEAWYRDIVIREWK